MTIIIEQEVLYLISLLFSKGSSSLWWPEWNCFKNWHHCIHCQDVCVSIKVHLILFCKNKRNCSELNQTHLYVSLPSQSAALLPTKATISASFHFICKFRIVHHFFISSEIFFWVLCCSSCPTLWYVQKMSFVDLFSKGIAIVNMIIKLMYFWQLSATNKRE